MVYLDNSATSRFHPTEVIAAVTKALTDGGNPGRSGHSVALAAAQNVFRAREALLSLTGAQHAHCLFCANCTHALNTGLLGLLRGGHVITTVTEHNSVLRPLFKLQREGKIRLTVLQPDSCGLIDVDRVASEIKRDTCLVAVNAVSNVTGTAQPIEKIGALCRTRGIFFMVDGAQSVGYLPTNFEHDCIDLLAIAPHKGLHAPMGVGALIVGDRVKLEPILLGGTGTDSRNPIQVPVMPDGMEAGTLPYPAICGITAACDWVNKNGKIAATNNLKLTGTLIPALKARGYHVYSSPNPCGIVAFEVPSKPSAVAADALDARGICIRGGLHCAPLMHKNLGTIAEGLCRVSFSCDNTQEDLDTLLTALDEITT